jgi:hypothetical protein
MTNDANVKKLLQDHERRIAALEAMLAKPKSAPISKIKKSLTDHVIDLRNAHFFSTMRTVEETHKKLQGTYPCELNRVAVALLRLASNKQLRKATKKDGTKEYKAYVW